MSAGAGQEGQKIALHGFDQYIAVHTFVFFAFQTDEVASEEGWATLSEQLVSSLRHTIESTFPELNMALKHDRKEGFCLQGVLPAMIDVRDCSADDQNMDGIHDGVDQPWLPPSEAIDWDDSAPIARGLEQVLGVSICKVKRGVCIVLRLHHIVGDAAAISQIMQVWGRNCRALRGLREGESGKEVTASEIICDRGMQVKHARLEGHAEPKVPPFCARCHEIPATPFREQVKFGKMIAGNTCTVRRRFTPADIQKLKLQAGQAENGSFTTNDVLCAEVIRDVAERLEGMAGQDSDPLTFLFPADLRGRCLDIPKGYFGNALTCCLTDNFTFAEVRERCKEADTPLAWFANKVVDAKKRCLNEAEVKNFLAWEKARTERPRGVMAPPIRHWTPKSTA